MSNEGSRELKKGVRSEEEMNLVWTAKEIRKLQRTKRQQPPDTREAIAFANATAFTRPCPSQKADGAKGIERWRKRWNAHLNEALRNINNGLTASGCAR